MYVNVSRCLDGQGGCFCKPRTFIGLGPNLIVAVCLVSSHLESKQCLHFEDAHSYLHVNEHIHIGITPMVCTLPGPQIYNIATLLSLSLMMIMDHFVIN